MRILMVHNRYGAVSGEELMAERIVDLLRSRGHEVETFYRDSADIDRMPLGKVRSFFSGIYSPKARREIRETLQRFRPDIVQVQNLFPLISPAVLPEIHSFGVPIVMRLANYRLVCPNGLLLFNGRVCLECLGGREWRCVVNNCESSYFKSAGYATRNFVARKGRFFLDNVTMYYAQTKLQRDLLAQEGGPGDSISVIPNMVEIPEKLPKFVFGDYVAFAGRISPEKGMTALIGAARRNPDIPFKCAGRYTDLAEVDENIPGNVEFLGHLSGSRYELFFRNARFLVAPSLWYEGFPGVILESMLHGKPVISSRIGGLPEIVDDGKTGLLFEPGDAEELSDKIRHLWNDRERCNELGKDGQAKVVREYNREKYYERLMTVYNKAISLCRS